MAREVQQHIFLVDDDPVALKSLYQMLKSLEVTIRCFPDSGECLEQLNSHRCDLLIASQEMHKISGIEVLKHARRLNPDLPVMIISGSCDVATVVEAMKAGAEDFLEKPLSKKTLIQKVKSILQENSMPLDTCGRGLLSQTEMRVLKLVAQSKTSSEIAGLLHRSHRTIQVHRARLLHKLNVRNSVALVSKALKMGLVDVEPGRKKGKTIRRPVKKR